MPGTITRDGVILDMPILDESIRAKMLDAMVSAFLQNHPDQIREQAAKIQATAAASTI